MFNAKGKITTLLFIIVFIVVLAIAAYGFLSLQRERARVVELQAQLIDTEARLKNTSMRLDETKKLVDSLNTKLLDSDGQVKNLSDTLDEERRTSLERSLEVSQLKAEIEKQNTLRADLEQKLNAAEEALQKTRKDFDDIQSVKNDLEKRIKSIEEKTKGVELGQIVVSTPEGTKPQVSLPASLEAKVLVVNKEYDFMVVNAGANNGIAADNKFSVFKKDKLLGEVKAEKIQDSMCALNFVTPKMKNKLNVGDSIVLKVK